MDTIAALTEKKLSGRPPELLYIQPSKGIYETGEDLWFKVYLLDSQTMALSGKSNTLYLQLLNSRDSIVWQEKYPVENSMVSGHVYVNEKLPEGDYYLEGYTKYSFYENDPEGITTGRKIKIIRNVSNPYMEEVHKDTTFRFEVYPEGGNLVSGIRTKLAFKATDGKGIPVHVEGTLFQDEEPLASIKSIHDGMGAVYFIPFHEKKYKIELTNGRSYSLPDIYPEGMVLQLCDQTEHQLDFMVFAKNACPNQPVYLLGQMRGMVCCLGRGVVKDSLHISIPLNNFMYQGIAEFTLLNETLEPIAERLVYIHPDKKLYITAEPEKKSYAVREKVTIKLKVTNEHGEPVRTHLGMTVYDHAYRNLHDPVNILAHSYLSSQIRGRVHNPAYYFEETNNERMDGLDLLLLTQGWRRYIWNSAGPAYSGKPFLHDEINGIQTFKSVKKQKQHQRTTQLIQVSGAAGNAHFIATDSTGRFTVSSGIMKEFRGGYIYLKPMLSKEFKPLLEIDDSFSLINLAKKCKKDYYPIIDLTKYKYDAITDLPVISGDSTILLDEVVITRKSLKPFRDKFMGRLDSLAQAQLTYGWVCECKNTPPFLNDYLPGYTHHIHHTASYKGKKLAPVHGETYRLIKYEQQGNRVYVADVKTVVYNGPLYTDEELLRMNHLWRVKGYYAEREFYQPDEYDIKLSVPDARNTLLWEPTIMTDDEGEASVSFYCSDVNTRFTGIIEGIDGEGLLGSTECEFKVIRR